jgi:tannase/feruloyl esterase
MVKFWITRISAGCVCALLLWSLASERVVVPVTAAGSCESLLSLKLPSATITMAKVQPTPEGGVKLATGPGRTVSIPEACRVAATLTPSSDSEIKMELWMPTSNWNGRYQAVGNGAFNGNINVNAIVPALARGYAASSTDGGHTGGSASFGLGHPEKVIDFGWRAVHETSVVSKKIIESFYGNGPKMSYFNGCSAGGRQAMQEAQRFPADFNGIIAGAPGLDWTGRAAQAVRIAKRLEQNEAARLGQAQRQLLHNAVLESCDLMDGVKDGVLENPKRCKFDPGVLECKGADSASCLTPPQVETARMIYSAAVNPKTKRAIHGLAPGSELGWTDLGWTASARATGLDQFRFLVFGDPTWNIQKFNWESDIALAEEKDNNTINALDPNLKPFISRGGKLISYHGWSDPQISPANTTQYYDRVVEVSGGRDNVHKSYRLFMAPGMGHCSGGEGPNTFDMLTALERWVEGGIAPDQIAASITRPTAMLDRSRPLCPYPQVAVYKGSGSTDDAMNFACRGQ